MMDDGTIATAADLLRHYPSETDERLYRRLIATGVPAESAARLLEFLPLAYCRALLEGIGVRFSDEFQRVLADGSLSTAKTLASEPWWHAVVKFVAQQVREGISQRDLLTMAGRSAEFDAVNQLLNRGSDPKNVILTPVVFVGLNGASK